LDSSPIARVTLDNVADIYPLTPVQKGMLFHTLAAPGSGMYVEQYSCTINGPLRTELFQQAWDRALARHPALRTAFLWQDLDEPLQVAREQVNLSWTTHDWRDQSRDDRAQQWETFLAEDRTRGFDLIRAPLMRMALIQTEDASFRFVWTFHHLLLDGWSSVTVLREVWTDYAAHCSGDRPSLDPPRPFRDYVAWHRARDLDVDEAYWTDQLSGFQTPTPLHIDEPPRAETDPQEDQAGRAERQFALSAEVTEAARQFARRQRITLNTLVQGAWALLLSRYSGEDDVVYGTTVAGRPSELSGVESMVGAFINTVPMRMQPPPNATPTDWLQDVQSTLLAARTHAYAPLNRIQQWSPISGGQDLFKSLFVFENHPPAKEHLAETAGIQIEEATFRGQSNYPLALLAIPGPQLRFTAVYDTTRFSEVRIEGLLGHLATLLTGLAKDRTDRLADCPILTARERRALLASSAHSVSPDRLPHDSVPQPVGSGASSASLNQGIHHRIEQVARQTPDAAAVCFEDKTLTYAELEAQAQTLAAFLADRDVASGDVVGLCVERSPAMIVGLLAILKAGGAYVPLDPTYPADRLQLMIEDSSASAVVTTRDLVGQVPDSAATKVPIDAVLQGTPESGQVPHSDEASASFQCPSVDPEQLAYVMYTSGSTGSPKGVMVTHSNLLFSTRARRAYYPDAPDAFLLLSPLGFDSSVAGLFWTLTSGGTLVLPRPGEEKDVRRLAALVHRHEVSHTLCVPSLYALLLDHASPKQLVTLRTVIVAGEACPPALPARHYEQLPDTTLYNEYGPTETTVWATVHRVEAQSPYATVPIGRPIPGVQVYILDKQQRLVPPGIPGELYIGGPGVTPGYLNRPDQTATRFIDPPFDVDDSQQDASSTADSASENSRGHTFAMPDRAPSRHLYRTGDRVRAHEDGLIEFLGRIDSQVKLRGHRIEIGEVEAVLRQQPDVADGAVAVCDLGGARHLVAYVVLVSSAQTLESIEEGPALGALRSALRQQLPPYMVPEHVEFVHALPRTPNGKIDRAALPFPTPRRTISDDERVPPDDPVEMRMLALWQDLLDIRPLSMTDNFFDLGGDSLLAVSLSARIEDTFDTAIPVSILFDAPTPRALIELIRTEVPSTESPVPIRATGQRPPLFCVPGSGGYPILYHKLATYLGADQPVYAFEPRGVDGRALPHTSIEAMAQQHLHELRRVRPEGPYHLCGFSVGGLVAYEMAQQLHQMGDGVALLALLDTRLPRLSWPARWWERLKDDIRYWMRRREALSYLRDDRVMPKAVRNSFPAKVHERAARRYQPRSYPGAVHLFAASRSGELTTNVEKWADLIEGSLSVHEIPAEHDLVKEPYVGEAAQQLAECMDGASEGEDHRDASRRGDGRTGDEAPSSGPEDSVSESDTSVPRSL
jgi:amino acid adenylation domain-containing protein